MKAGYLEAPAHYRPSYIPNLSPTVPRIHRISDMRTRCQPLLSSTLRLPTSHVDVLICFETRYWWDLPVAAIDNDSGHFVFGRVHRALERPELGRYGLTSCTYFRIAGKAGFHFTYKRLSSFILFRFTSSRYERGLLFLSRWGEYGGLSGSLEDEPGGIRFFDFIVTQNL